MTESEIKRDIMDYLNHLPRCYARLIQVGRIPGRTNHSKGIADIIAVYKGRFVAIEVKTKTGNLSPEQDEYLKTVARCGGIAFTARSLDDVRSHL